MLHVPYNPPAVIIAHFLLVALSNSQKLSNSQPDVDAVLWDFGGVFTSSPFEAFNEFEAKHGLPNDFIRTVNSTNPDSNAWAKLEANSVSREEFDSLFKAESRALGHPVNGRDVLMLLSGKLRPKMVRVLATCKKHFKVGCITNNIKPEKPEQNTPATRQFTDTGPIMEKFDVIIESSIEGVRKPSPRIYEIACERLGVEADRCVFLDDLGINLKPARAMGMTTIKVVDPDDAIRELEEATGLRFD